MRHPLSRLKECALISLSNFMLTCAALFKFMLGLLNALFPSLFLFIVIIKSSKDAEKKLTNLLENGVDANGKKLSGGELRAQEKVQRKATALAQEHAMKLIAAYKAKNSSAVLQSERNAAAAPAAADGTKKPAAATKGDGDGPDRGILDDAKAGISDWFSELGPTRMTLVYSLSLGILIGSVQFYSHATRMAGYLSEPQIIVRNSSTGEIVDDFREAYFHIRDNTPKDARVMAWWDYGYVRLYCFVFILFTRGY